MKYLLGIDFGGGSSKATLIDTNGNIIAESIAEYPTLYPFVGACEQEPRDWLNALKENIQKLKEVCQIDFFDILCIAIDSATHTAVLCDEKYEPVRPAIHWTDSRSRRETAYLRDEYGERIFEQSFHKPDPIWTLPQIMWVREHEPNNFKRIKHIFFEKDYIRYCLTDVWCTDYIEAQGSMLYDCTKKEWSEWLCSLAGLEKEVLPPIVNPTDIIGKITKQASEETGLYEGTPVICGTTDTCMEVFAAGAVSCKDMTVKLATAGRICVITEQPYPNRHLVNYSHIAEGLWYPGAATKAAAASYRWYRDTFGGDYEELNRGAEEVPLGCEGLVFHPYLNGELTPYADPMLCGSFTGVRATHTKAHFTRAVLEGVCYSLLDAKLALDEIGMEYQDVATLIGGGAKGALWRQIAADVLGVTLKVMKNSDSSFGSAMLAGIAVGVFQDAKDAVDKCVEVKDIAYPDMERHQMYQELFKEYKRIHDVLAPVYRERELL